MREVKKLRRERKKRAEELLKNKEDTANLQRQGRTIREDLEKLDKQIDLELSAIQNETLEVSDHAIVRYLERVEGLDIDRIKREIKGTIKPINGIEDFKKYTYHKDGFRYVVIENSVVTVTTKN